MKKFEDLSLSKELLKSLLELKYLNMTPIQAKSLPLILEGKDVIGQAKTGSGKTAAFALGLLNSVDVSRKNIQSLVLCPTRELAEQVANEIRRLARRIENLKIITLCGGILESIQEKSLRTGIHVAVGTPGRVFRLLDKGSLDLRAMKIFILDEADRMLDMGFYDDIIKVVAHLPRARQTLLFSASFPDNIRSLSKGIQRNTHEVKVDTVHVGGEISQVFYEILPDQDKNDLLYRILGKYRPDRMLVFCRTKKESKDVAEFLFQRKISAMCINSDLEQNERTKVLTKFSNRSLSVLVATDVAARGLDIQDLASVVNYNLPSGSEAYIHRIGRTGRAGNKGLAFSFFSPQEKFRLEEIENFTGKPVNIEDHRKVTYSQKYDLVPPMKTMYISGGKKDKLRPGDIVGALTCEAKLKADDIGEISVLSHLSYVAIRKKSMGQAIEKLSHGKIKKRKFKVGLT